jgi:hypothetical protein
MLKFILLIVVLIVVLIVLWLAHVNKTKDIISLPRQPNGWIETDVHGLDLARPDVDVTFAIKTSAVSGVIFALLRPETELIEFSTLLIYIDDGHLNTRIVSSFLPIPGKNVQSPLIQEIISNKVINDDTFHEVKLTLSSIECKLFIDGNLDTEIMLKPYPPIRSSQAYFGGIPGSRSEVLVALIRDVRFGGVVKKF